MLYDMLLLKIVLNVYPIRLRFISARLLASVASIFKSAGCKGISFVAVKKLILNVSEPPWRAVGMSVVLRSSVFVLQTRTSVERYTAYILWRTGSFALGCLLGAILGASRFSSAAALFFVEDNPCFKFYKRTLII